MRPRATDGGRAGRGAGELPAPPAGSAGPAARRYFFAKNDRFFAM